MTTKVDPRVTDDLALRSLRGAAGRSLAKASDYDPLLELIGDARFVLLGEASHGTHEFYRERAQITKRLIREKGFTAVAVEADWPDAYRVNRYVRGRGDDAEAVDALAGFRRFPAWMWRNADVLDFVGWLRAHNDEAGPGRPEVGFYGLDLYSLHASIEAVLAYLDKVDPEAAGRARARYACFDYYGEDTQAYGFASGLGLGPSCEHEVVTQLVDLRRSAAEYALRDGRIAEDDYFYAEQNARLVRDAEQYYRTMYRGEVSSWNLRDRHMAETLEALVEYLGRAGRPAEGRGLGPQLPPRRRAGDADGGPGRVERRPAGARAVRPRRDLGRLHHLRRHGDGGLELGRAGRAEAGPTGPAGELRGAVPRRRPGPVPAVPPRRRPGGGPASAAIGAGHRGDLPAGDGAGQPLLPREPAGAVRRRAPLRPDAGRRAAGALHRVGRGRSPRDLPVGRLRGGRAGAIGRGTGRDGPDDERKGTPCHRG